ncbi:hypothetical protein M5005_Spy0650 [Streptococcus pyogenes MGAS5005]|nr:hypothetical protein M28_Spy0631 [Streptococcus pyogenes MGAS6180]AAZ51268.1 hypothetical protein M5005_Spy0650 [Streptococcus pyogenes MGAS5005]ABF33774.1 hypothetical protein MGAS10270_Spy0709 [Streptococcus pyogenes MGAS10270]
MRWIEKLVDLKSTSFLNSKNLNISEMKRLDFSVFN